MPPIHLVLMVFGGLLIMSLVGLVIGRWGMLATLLVVLVAVPFFKYGTLSPCGMTHIDLAQAARRVVIEHPGPRTGAQVNKELIKWSTHMNSLWRCVPFLVRANLDTDLAYDLVGDTSKVIPDRMPDGEGAE